ncbi:hypothetical protein DPSP01_008915 [Paraphaeosphaeria sporulosa]|uniref:CorA-like transporter domain-containing protein n=1 Tax=Paraphaeosphaeria sporulosa TaxID=1460663 RepID=A0A177CJH2_9PLEO|nr:uncharacterized protein CC84DRAFT_1175438 [Paraphaeosphaeria sporulosa]OAG07684.1 hypothetical protein CC84DRAFT_1175438 [Paraphaeosphaeria sporulosa]
METSSYFERTLFYDRSPATEEYYARSAETIFEKEPSRSKIEVRVQSSIDASYYIKKQDCSSLEEKAEDAESPRISPKRKAVLDEKRPSQSDPQPASRADVAYKVKVDDAYDSDSDYAWSISSRASSTALSTGLDQHHGSLPPTYPGPPILTIIDLEPSNLRNFTRQTKHEFRVFYIRQRNSYSRLQITKELFEELLRCCHVFPRFNEYVIGFGTRNSETEVGPPPLTFRPLCEVRSNRYHGFECSYILRYIEFTNRTGVKFPWSLRQFAVYHRYKPKSGRACSTWILVGASQRTETRIDDYTRSIDDLNASNPFELHVTFVDTAIASWRPYLVSLTKLVAHQSDKATGVEVEGDDDLVPITFEDHQELKMIEDRVADLILCLDSTLDTVATFEEMYEQFSRQQIMPSSVGNKDRNSAYGIDIVIFGLRRRAREISYRQKQAKVLLKKVQTTRTLISSLLEQKNGLGTNEQLSAVRKLVEQSQEETALMRELAEKNSRDSSSMRILTIITMIYLPCTIVSNFFSTQFVKQIDSPSGDTKLGYAQNAWLFFAISVPLTLATIGVWYLWVNGERIFRNVWAKRTTSDMIQRRKPSSLGLKELLV